jgi:hypothetical protein
MRVSSAVGDPYFPGVEQDPVLVRPIEIHAPDMRLSSLDGRQMEYWIGIQEIEYFILVHGSFSFPVSGCSRISAIIIPLKDLRLNFECEQLQARPSSPSVRE